MFSLIILCNENWLSFICLRGKEKGKKNEVGNVLDYSQAFGKCLSDQSKLWLTSRSVHFLQLVYIFTLTRRISKRFSKHPGPPDGNWTAETVEHPETAQALKIKKSSATSTSMVFSIIHYIHFVCNLPNTALQAPTAIHNRYASCMYLYARLWVYLLHYVQCHVVVIVVLILCNNMLLVPSCSVMNMISKYQIKRWVIEHYIKSATMTSLLEAG